MTLSHHAAQGRRFPLFRDLVTYGQNPDDSTDMRDRKAMCVVVIMVVFGISLSYFFVPGRSVFLQRFDWAMLTLEMSCLLLFWHHRSVERLFWTFVPPYLSFMALFVLFNGTKEGDVLAFLTVPCAAVVIFGPKRSMRWFLVCLMAMVVLPVLDQLLPMITVPSAQSATNPEGYVFHSPWKKPLGMVESIAMAGVTVLLYFLLRSVHHQLTLARIDVERARDQHRALTDAVFPKRISERLRADHTQIIAEEIPEASVLFADLAGFTAFSQQRDPHEVLEVLEQIFSIFDEITAAHGGEKLKTMGDGYLAAVGLNQPYQDHAARACSIGLAMIRATQAVSQAQALGLRVGVHSGPVVAGVMGRVRPHYDIWGGTVNMAHRLQAAAQVDQLQITRATMTALSDHPGFALEAQGETELKGLGPVPIWRVSRPEARVVQLVQST